jgi:hypothetical protein
MDKKTNRRSPIKEAPLRLPGQGIDEKLRDLAFNEGMGFLMPATCAWMLAIGSAMQFAFSSPMVRAFLFGLAVVLTIRLAFGFRRLVRQARDHRLGRQGERAVGQLLQTLDLPGTRVFHDIPADECNIDHVIVCDRGIYVVETKTWSKGHGESVVAKEGQILLRGRPVSRNPVGQVAGASHWFSQMLEGQTGHTYWCQAVVVLPGWFVASIDATTKDQAWVLEPKALLKWILRDPVRLAPEDVRRIEGAIARHVRSRISGDIE